MAGGTPNLLEAQQLQVRFGGLLAVNGVDVCLRAGEIVAIIGPNGAGKTTVFNILTGIYEPSVGRVSVAGTELAKPLDWRALLGFGLVGLGTATLLVLGAHVQALWQAVILDHYLYQQPFDWAAAGRGFGRFFSEQPARRLVGPGLIGALLGALAAVIVWRRSRRAPEVAARRGLARTFQTIRLFRKMTVLDNILIGLDRRRHSQVWDIALRLPRYRREHRQSVAEAEELLRFVGLEQQTHRLADQLSYGHQHRLEIGRALATQPQVLLLDEPAAGLNPSESEELMRLIRRIRKRGVSILLIEHDMKVVAGISDRVLVLDHGEKIAEGTPAEVWKNERVIEAYLGKSYGSAS